MARIELRDCLVRFKDGFGGTAKVNDTPAQGNTTLEIDTLANLTNGVIVVPVGARFMVGSTTYTVTAVKSNEIVTVTLTEVESGTFALTFGGQTTSPEIAYNAEASAVQSALEALSSIGAGNVLVTGNAGGPYTIEFYGDLADTNVGALTADGTNLGGGGAPDIDATVTHEGGTWELTFTPAIPAGDVPLNDADITFLPQQIEIKVGDGNLTYTEHSNYDYLLDRGDLDTVREGDQVPLDVRIDCVYEHITTGTSENISPLDALKGVGGASGWFSSASDQCEPYAIDIEVEHVVPCGTAQDETTLFPDFRSETREINFKDATIAITGKCNAVQPVVTRS